MLDCVQGIFLYNSDYCCSGTLTPEASQADERVWLFIGREDAAQPIKGV